MGSQNRCQIFRSGKPLHGIGETSTLEDVKNIYDQWANDYNDDMVKYGYRTPTVCFEVFLQEAEEYGISPEWKILDVGTGTGVIGELFKAKGYMNIDGVDISSEMLKIARERNCYKKLVCGSVGHNHFPVFKNEYDGVLCIGSLGVGHINSNGINEMLSILKPGDLFFFTVRCDVIDERKYGYTEEINKILKEDKLRMILKQKEQYLSTADDNDPAKQCYLFGFLKFSTLI